MSRRATNPFGEEENGTNPFAADNHHKHNSNGAPKVPAPLGRTLPIPSAVVDIQKENRMLREQNRLFQERDQMRQTEEENRRLQEQVRMLLDERDQEENRMLREQNRILRERDEMHQMGEENRRLQEQNTTLLTERDQLRAGRDSAVVAQVVTADIENAGDDGSTPQRDSGTTGWLYGISCHQFACLSDAKNRVVHLAGGNPFLCRILIAIVGTTIVAFILTCLSTFGCSFMYVDRSGWSATGLWRRYKKADRYGYTYQCVLWRPPSSDPSWNVGRAFSLITAILALLALIMA